jgi:hypothetical protein
MATFKLFHRILFNLEFEVSGYKEDVAQYIQVVPDKETNKLFSQYRMMLRKYKNSYLALIETGSDAADLGEPKIEIPENAKFRFQVKVSDIVFFSRTHLYAYDFRNNVLVLSNEANHAEGPDLLLSRHIVDYAGADDYKPGYLVRSGGTYYSALQSSSSADAHPVTEPSYWKIVADGSYVSQADLQPRPPAVDLNTFMVIDVRHSSTLSPAYQLLDASSRCREVTYKVKLLNK